MVLLEKELQCWKRIASLHVEAVIVLAPHLNRFHFSFILCVDRNNYSVMHDYK